MKISRNICDLCASGREATRVLKFFALAGDRGRGAPKAKSAYDLCEYCYGEVSVALDAIERTSEQ